MKPTKTCRTATNLVPSALLSILITASTAFGGSSFPPDGLQIVFSDDGAGGTAVTVSEGGVALSDVDTGNAFLGFLNGIDVDTLEPNVPPALAALADIPKTDMTDPIELEWRGITNATVVYDRIDIDVGSTQGFFLESRFGSIDVIQTGAELTAIDGNGLIPLPYSTFAAAHGQSFPTNDGFTFVFEDTPTSQAAAAASACADKSALLRKIKKLKKKLKKLKRAGNVTKAKKLKKKLNKLYKSLC